MIALTSKPKGRRRTAKVAVLRAHGGNPSTEALELPSTSAGTASPSAKADIPSTSAELPAPQVLSETKVFLWDDDAAPVANYVMLGQRLAAFGDLFRRPEHGNGLILASPCEQIPPKPIVRGAQLAPAIADRLRIRVFKKGKPAGSMPSGTHLNTMLAAEVFLQQFRPLDAVVTVPMYLPDFALTKPGYSDGGPGQRIYYAGKPGISILTHDTITRFLDVIEFATNADRTGAVAAALTVLLRNHWLGGKPLLVVTSTKSHGGKDTVIEFAAGRTPHASLSYERADWALQKNFAALIDHNPDLGLINIENVRLNDQQEHLESSFLERFLTDPEPVVFSTGTGDPHRRSNNLVLATSTNHGRISEDLMNRAVPVHLEPVGEVADRQSPIGNPRLVFLPENRETIEAELRGMIEQWKLAGQPLDENAKHPFSGWARTIGGILMVAGFKDFLGNYAHRRTEDDPVRQALGLLGSERPDQWLPPEEWVLLVAELGLTKRLIPAADRDTGEGRKRGLGVVLSAHRNEQFRVETENDVVEVRLERARRRFDRSEPHVRYMFELLTKEQLSEEAK